ncbi:MAG TPA: M23 family metallopeptidase, partial [Syntrophobacteria bacterium]|nr:M23 family metallopeptidase [Syntrophobacteria bacterium]
MPTLFVLAALVLVMIGLPPAVSGDGSTVSPRLLPPQGPVAQGEVARILVQGVPAGATVAGLWQGESLGFFPLANGEWGALLGVDLRLSPGTYRLEVRLQPKGETPVLWTESVQVVAKDYGLESLQLPERMVTLDAKSLKRVKEEEARFNAVWGRQSPECYWREPFLRPVPGALLSTFGRNRVINGAQRSPHTGLDLRAAVGEPVLASNSGRVALVGDFFFNGRAVVIDHGFGLYTMYFHLSEVKVKEGERVERGAVIGLAGATGRASGPHLHWGVRLAGAR